MSLLIKGMDMPSACNKCQFHNAYICTAKGSPVSLQIYLCDKKPCDCQLAEIPTSHGRLIDANEIREKMKKYGFKAPDMTVSEFIEDEITTIIEAEEG